MISWLEWFCIFAALTLAAVVTALPSPAYAACDVRDKFVEALATQYKEYPRARAVTDKLNVLEVFRSQHGTWTIVMTGSSGITCTITSGEGWKELPATVYGHAT